MVPLKALSLELTLGPISEGGTRIEGAKRARIDGEAQEKAGEPSLENFWEFKLVMVQFGIYLERHLIT